MQGKFSVTVIDKSPNPKYGDGYLSYEIDFNCYHFSIRELDRQTGRRSKILFARGNACGQPDRTSDYVDTWQDEFHKPVIEALKKLNSTFEDLVNVQLNKEKEES